MTRRFLGFTALFLTLLAGGCQQVRSARSDSAAATNPLPVQAPSYATMKSANHPEPLSPSNDNPPKAAPPADAPKWAKLTEQPPPLPVRVEPLAHQAAAPEVVNPMPTIETAPKHPFVRALECALENRPEEALTHLQSYDARTQDLLLRALPTFSTLAKNTNLSPADVNVLSEQLTGILNLLQQNSEFTISRMAYCESKSITGFAVYKPLPQNHEFIAAVPGRFGESVELYVGFKNFVSEPKQGQFETKLASHVAILDDKGKTIWTHRFDREKLKLVSPMRLSEYYHGYGFLLPESVPPGSYTLVVEMTDETRPGAPRTASAHLPLRIAASKD